MSDETGTNWYVPTSFKELAAALLSLVTMALLVWAVFKVYSLTSAGPVVTDINGTTESFEPFERAKDVLNILFPLFAAVFSFWLGVTVEGRRADSAESRARTAEEELLRTNRLLTAIASESQPGTLANVKRDFPELLDV